MSAARTGRTPGSTIVLSAPLARNRTPGIPNATIRQQEHRISPSRQAYRPLWVDLTSASSSGLRFRRRAPFTSTDQKPLR